MKKSDKRLHRQKRRLFEGLSRESLSRVRAQNQELRQEIAQLRECLVDAYAERDVLREKLRRALGTMEDAREMVMERAS